MHQIPTRIARILIILMTFFALAELITRIEYFGVRSLSYSATASIKPFINSEFVYAGGQDCGILDGMLPHVSGMFKGVPFKTNSHGFRDFEYALEKADNVIRIIVLGASTTMGAGVRIEETYAKVLEKMLNTDGGSPHYDVLNFGYGGMSIECNIQKMPRLAQWEADLFLLALGPDHLSRTNAEQLMKLQRDLGTRIFTYHYTQPQTPDYFLSKETLYVSSLDVSHGSDNYIYPSDGHPDAYIHSIYASRLAEIILRNKKTFLSRPRGIHNSFIPIGPVSKKDHKQFVINGFWRSYFWEKAVARVKDIALRACLVCSRVIATK